MKMPEFIYDYIKPVLFSDPRANSTIYYISLNPKNEPISNELDLDRYHILGGSYMSGPIISLPHLALGHYENIISGGHYEHTVRPSVINNFNNILDSLKTEYLPIVFDCYKLSTRQSCNIFVKLSVDKDNNLVLYKDKTGFIEMTVSFGRAYGSAATFTFKIRAHVDNPNSDSNVVYADDGKYRYTFRVDNNFRLLDDVATNITIDNKSTNLFYTLQFTGKLRDSNNTKYHIRSITPRNNVKDVILAYRGDDRQVGHASTDKYGAICDINSSDKTLLTLNYVKDSTSFPHSIISLLDNVQNYLI